MPLAKDVHPASNPSAVRTEPARDAELQRRPKSPPIATEAEAHLLRLCLELQLDAMLLTLGAAAAGAARRPDDDPAAEFTAVFTAEPTSGPTSGPASGPASGPTSGPTSGPASESSNSAARESGDTAQSPPWRRWVLEDVELVRGLAGDVLAGGASLPTTLGSDLDQAVPAAAVDNLVARYESMTTLLADVLPSGPDVAPAPYRTHAQAALAHYQDRLRDLRSTRLEHTPPRGLTLPATTDHPPVPGEWLG
jgi:hypothetical protein